MTITDGGRLSLADAFTREHREIDANIEAYLGAVDEEPRRRARPLLAAMEALRRHIYLEEEIVFPNLPQGALMMPLMVMHREHGELWRRMDALAARLQDEQSDAADLDSACREMLALLDAHNSKEEPIIYPHMDAELDDDDRDRVRALLETGTIPEGWTCRDAAGGTNPFGR